MNDLDHLFDSIRSDFNNEFENFFFPQDPKKLYDPIRYVIKGKGKRLRPILVHIIGRALRSEPKSIMAASIAVELLHNFTLIHDDIMDDDTIRHGEKTVHKNWDQSTAILAGDALFSYSQIAMIKFSKNVKIYKIFNETIIEICEGQALDINFENNNSINQDQYLDMIEKKSGALLGFCSRVIPEDLCLEKRTCYVMDNFGRNLGKGFQIQDDILEIFSDTKNMGKSLGSDIVSGKQTILSILAREKNPKKWSDFLKIYLSEKDNLDQIRNFLNETGVKKTAENLAESFFQESLLCLEELKNIDKGEIEHFIDFIKFRGK